MNSKSAEHWLTLMTCTICQKTPDNSPVYKCNYSHTICFPCFENLVKAKIPVCKLCGSDEFTRQDVSADFLRKLKTKPGIGRPCRYILDDTNQRPPEQATEPDNIEPVITVEELFQLPKHKLHDLFAERTQEKIRYLNSLSATECTNGDLPNEQMDSSISYYERELSNWQKESVVEGASSHKPLKCPHGPCEKIIAISSFKSHYHYEHYDFKRYNLIRSTELELSFDPKYLELVENSLCLGIITLYQMPRRNDVNGGDKEIDSFWIMVSGSPNISCNHGYVLFWLFTNKIVHNYNCTLELSSQNDLRTMTTFCRVNGIYESQSISDIEKKLNCLYITHATVRNMRCFGPNMKFHLTIH